MVTIPVQCPHCHSTEVIKAGKQGNGTQRYQCQNDRCERWIFLLLYQDRGCVLEICRPVVDMAINGSGIRDMARVLRISPTTVIAVLKKGATLHHVNPALLPPRPRAGTGRVRPKRAVEVDEMWSFVGAKERARWLWHAVDHHQGESWPMSSAPGRMQCSRNSRPYSPPLGSPDITLTRRASIGGISCPRSIG